MWQTHMVKMADQGNLANLAFVLKLTKSSIIRLLFVVLLLIMYLGKKKKGKSKAKTVSLDQFLQDKPGGGSPSITGKPLNTSSWADASEPLDADGEATQNIVCTLIINPFLIS